MIIGNAFFVALHGKCHVCGLYWVFLQARFGKVCVWMEAGGRGGLHIWGQKGKERMGEKPIILKISFREQSRD